MCAAWAKRALTADESRSVLSLVPALALFACQQLPAGDQSRSETLTGIIGARRAWTVSMISPLSMPSR
jgi:hypothetical protein